MREAIGGTWLLGLVLTFIVFFTSFLALSVNYSKAFGVKNTIVDLLGKYEGNNCNSRSEIKDYLTSTGYLVPGYCTTDYTGYNIDGTEVGSGKKAYYCIENKEVNSMSTLSKKYYKIMVFFKIDLPMVGDLTTFRIKGETESVYFAKDQVSTEC